MPWHAREGGKGASAVLRFNSGLIQRSIAAKPWCVFIKEWKVELKRRKVWIPEGIDDLEGKYRDGRTNRSFAAVCSVLSASTMKARYEVYVESGTNAPLLIRSEQGHENGNQGEWNIRTLWMIDLGEHKKLYHAAD